MKKILLAIMIVTVLALPVLATELASPPIIEKELIAYFDKVGFQVRIPVYQVWRDVSFYKYEKGTKLTDKEIDKLTEDEKRWYEQGYIVKYGEWQGDDKEEEDKIIQTAIYGSGTIIYSAELPEALQSREREIIVVQNAYSSLNVLPLQIKEKGVYAETLGMTNYHVIEPLVNKLNLGSKAEPINVYAEKDIITTIDPPTVTFIDEARPIQQKYSYLVDKEGKEATWCAETNVASIKFNIDQHYDIEATVVAYDKGLDVGILQVKNVAFQPFATFRRTECRVGEKVWIVHSPLAITKSIDRGFINQTHLDLGIDANGLGWNDQVKLDIASAPGSSGSGIFDENGYLVALFHGSFIHQMGYGYSFIEGGHLAHEGARVAEWLNWRGFSYIFHDPPILYKDHDEIVKWYELEQ